VLERCLLGEVRRQVIGTLSKGYRQRVGLAGAILHDPRVLVLDEPTVGLDPRQIVAIRELIRELGQKHTLLLSTHILPEVELLCRRVLIIDRGRIVAEGTPAEITTGGGSDLHFSSAPGLDLPALAAALSLPAGVVAEDRPGEYSIRAAMTPDLVADIAVWLRDKGYGLTELRTQRATLEEVFLALTREEAQ
jgi:ABC-2 type transport system ATP-binding protein